MIAFFRLFFYVMVRFFLFFAGFFCMYLIPEWLKGLIEDPAAGLFLVNAGDDAPTGMSAVILSEGLAFVAQR
jgi:hypothetical protein